MYLYICAYRSQGFARTGYLIPGCVGYLGLDWLGNSSRRAAAAAPGLGAWERARPTYIQLVHRHPSSIQASY